MDKTYAFIWGISHDNLYRLLIFLPRDIFIVQIVSIFMKIVKIISADRPSKFQEGKGHDHICYCMNLYYAIVAVIWLAC